MESGGTEEVGFDQDATPEAQGDKTKNIGELRRALSGRIDGCDARVEP